MQKGKTWLGSGLRGFDPSGPGETGKMEEPEVPVG